MTQRAASRNRPAGSLSGRRRGAQRRRQRADSRRVGLRARVRSLRARRCGLRARRGALCRSHLSRQSGSRRARSSVLGADGRRPGAGAGRARGRPDRRSSSTTRCSSSASPTSSPPAASSAGWRAQSEFGPRALGHRSILAAPHASEMRDRLNRDIKYREEFRPFAPVTPDRDGRPLFRAAARRRAAGAASCRASSLCGPSGEPGSPPSRTSTARRGCRRSSATWRRGCHALLEAYGRRTGVPVLLNTSFNVAGEPIVNRALEGYSTFRRCGIDVLVAGSTLVTKRARVPAGAPKEAVRMIKKRWTACGAV